MSTGCHGVGLVTWQPMEASDGRSEILKSELLAESGGSGPALRLWKAAGGCSPVCPY